MCFDWLQPELLIDYILFFNYIPFWFDTGRPESFFVTRYMQWSMCLFFYNLSGSVQNCMFKLQKNKQKQQQKTVYDDTTVLVKIWY